MNLSPPSDPNAAPLDVIHKSRLNSIAIGIGCLSFLWFGTGMASGAVLRLICFGVAGLLLLYFLFLEVQTIEFFPTYLSINYLLRKRRIERADIDYVSMETGSSRTGGVPMKYNYVQMRLKNGRKINFGSFREGIDIVYEKLKACESTNEGFLKGR